MQYNSGSQTQDNKDFLFFYITLTIEIKLLVEPPAVVKKDNPPPVGAIP